MADYANLFIEFIKKYVSFVFAFDFGLGFTLGHFIVVCFILGVLFRNIILKAKG